MENKKSQNEELKEYARKEFDKIDVDKKGYISNSDFADIIIATRQRVHAPPLGDLELRKIMKSLDPENTGRITFEAWFKFLRMGKRAADTATKQAKEQEKENK